MGVMMNEDRFGVVSLSVDPANMAGTATTAEQTFTVPGLKVGDFVAVSPGGATAGIAAVSARVSAADTLAVTFANPTAGAVNFAPFTWLIFWFRPEKAPLVVNA